MSDKLRIAEALIAGIFTIAYSNQTQGFVRVIFLLMAFTFLWIFCNSIKKDRVNQKIIVLIILFLAAILCIFEISHFLISAFRCTPQAFGFENNFEFIFFKKMVFFFIIIPGYIYLTSLDH